MRRREHHSGLGTLGILLIVLVVTALAVSGLVLYQRHTPSTAKSTAATSPTQTTTQAQSISATQPATMAMNTHQAADGSFSFSYPSNWYINDSINTSAAEDQIILEPVGAQSSNANAFRMSLWAVLSPDSQPGDLSDGTAQKLTNGINLWTSSLARSEVPTSPTSTSMMACPSMKIVSTDGKHFSYPLRNGKYLILTAGYCQSDKDTTSQTYEQLLTSQNWRTAVSIVQSIQLH